MPSGFISDDEMDRMEGRRSPGFISDEEMSRFESGSGSGFDWMSLARKAYPATALADAYRASGSILGMTGRASDYVLGAGARGIAALEEPAVRLLADARGVGDTPQTQEMLQSVEDLRKKGEALQAGTTDYGSALAEEIPRAEGGVAGHAAGVARGAVRLAGNVARDPLTYVALGKIAQAPAWLRAAAAGLFTVQGAEGALESGKRAYEAGLTPAGTEAATEALGSAWLTKKGAEHALQETARAIPKPEGAVYVHDPNATPEQVAARRASDAVEAQQRATIEQEQGSALDRATRRLLWERGAALKREPGPQAIAPDEGTPQAAALDAAMLQAGEGLATGQGPKPPVIERVSTLGRVRDPETGELVARQGPVGHPDMTPEVREALKRRLLQLWHAEGGPAEPAKGKQGPVMETEASREPTTAERWTRAFLRTVEPAFSALERMPGAGREVAGRLRAYGESVDKYVGTAEAQAKRSLQAALGEARPLSGKELAASPEAQAIQQWLDAHDKLNGPGRLEGPIKLVPLEALPENLRGPAEALRNQVLAERARAVELGILEPDAPVGFWHREALQPEQFSERAKAEQVARDRNIPLDQALAIVRGPGSQLVGGTRKSRLAGAERERTTGGGLEEGEYRTDWGAFLSARREMARRFAEVEHLGNDGGAILPLVNRLNGTGGKFSDRAFALTLADRLRGVEPQTRGNVLSSLARSTQAALGLVKSPVTQLTTLPNTAAEAGFVPTVKSVLDSFGVGRKVYGPDGREMRWTQPVRRLRAAMNEARLTAEEQGAAYAAQADTLNNYFVGTKQGGAADTFSRKVVSLPWVRGTGWTDTMQRVWAAGTAKYAVPKAWELAKQGDAQAQRQLDKWHVDWRREALTPEMLDTAAKQISDRSQFKVDIGHLPLWASSPLGKVAFQFQSFGYAHTKFVGAAFEEGIKHGNWRPVAYLASMGAAMGYLTDEAKRVIFSGKAPEDPTEEDFATAAKQAFSGRKHYDPSSPKGAAMAYIQGLGAAGGLGALSGLYERAAGGSVPKAVLGATGSDVEAADRLLAAGVKAASEGDASLVKKPALGLVAGLLPSVGEIPAAVRELAGGKVAANPGYAARLLDAAGVGAGSEARSAQAEGEQAAAAAAKAKKELAGLLAPQPERSAQERALAAEKKAARVGAYVEIARAFRAGDMDAAVAAAQRARAAGVEINRKTFESLRRRAIMGLSVKDLED